MDAAKEIVAKLEALEDQRLAIERELKRLRVSPAPGSAGANRRRVPLRASVSGVGGFRAAFVAAAVLAAVVAVAQSAVASIPDANGVIHACYHVDGRGRTDEGSSLRVIDPAAKYDGGTCRRDERALSWNQNGPRGPIGPAGMNWQGQWSAARSYGIKDAVFDGGSAWIALQPNTNSEPATGNSNWSLLAQKGDQGAPGQNGQTGPAGLTWQGQWSSTQSYTINDAVFDGGSAWIALQPNTNSEPATGNSNWSLLAQKGDQGAPGQNGRTGPAGLTWQGQWSSTQSYTINDAVFDGGSACIAIQHDTTSEPATGNSNWSLLAQKGDQGAPGQNGQTGPAGLTWQGQWSSTQSYAINDAVFDGGSAWIALQPNTNSEPAPSNANWSLLAQKGDQGNQGPAGVIHGYDAQLSPTGNLPRVTMAPIPPNSSPGALGVSVNVLQTAPVATSGTYYVTATAIAFVSPLDQVYCFLGTQSNNTATDGIFGAATDEGTSTPLFPHYTVSVTLPMTLSAGDKMTLYCYSSTGNTSSGIVDASITALPVNMATTASNAIQANLRARSTKRAISRLGGRRNR